MPLISIGTTKHVIQIVEVIDLSVTETCHVDAAVLRQPTRVMITVIMVLVVFIRTFPSPVRRTSLYPHGMSTDGQKRTNY